MKVYYVYILTNRYNKVIYIGFTDDLYRRCLEHKENKIKGFTYKYNVNKLIYYEVYDTAEEAKLREKRLKFWKRHWKIELIEQSNKQYRDIFYSLDK